MPVRDALARADEIVAQATVEGKIDPAFARTLTHMISTCGEQTRRTEYDLADLERALQPIAQASPDSADLQQHVKDATDAGATSLEHARHWTHRLSEDLPRVDQSVTQVVERFARIQRPTIEHQQAPAGHPDRWVDLQFTEELWDEMRAATRPAAQAVKLVSGDRLISTEATPTAPDQMELTVVSKPPGVNEWSSNDNREVKLILEGAEVSQVLRDGDRTEHNITDARAAEALGVDEGTWRSTRGVLEGGLATAHDRMRSMLVEESDEPAPVADYPQQRQAATRLQDQTRAAERSRGMSQNRAAQGRAVPGF